MTSPLWRSFAVVPAFVCLSLTAAASGPERPDAKPAAAHGPTGVAGGRIEVVGRVFAIAPGETVATFVRTGTKVPWFTGFFNNSMSAVAASAASQGVTAIAPVVREASRQ